MARIQYLNTDLELVSTRPLDTLGTEMTALELCGHVTCADDGMWYAMFEAPNADEPEPNILKLLDALDRLSHAAIAVLRKCTKIEFNIGYECGDAPPSHNQSLSHNTLCRLVRHGASLRVTIYPHSPPDDPRTKQFDLTTDQQIPL